MIRQLIGHSTERSSRVLAEYLLLFQSWSSTRANLKAPSWFSPPGTQAVLGQNLLRWSALDKIGSSSSDVFERRTSTGSEPFSLLVSLDATVFILPSVLILKETICPKICSKSRLKCAKSPFPVDVRGSKTSLLKLPNDGKTTTGKNSLSIIHCLIFCREKVNSAV